MIFIVQEIFPDDYLNLFPKVESSERGAVLVGQYSKLAFFPFIFLNKRERQNSNYSPLFLFNYETT